MIEFILNNSKISTDKPEGTSLLDYIRYEMDLPSTKIGCREGDCGACTVLEGEMNSNKLTYKSIVSCLTPLGNVHGKHIVTLEGLNMDELSPVQKAMVDNAATQCGFCTPGFIMGFSSHAMSSEISTQERAIDSVSGNICRCTGYKSIERAAATISGQLKGKDIEKPIEWLVSNKFLPSYFLNIHTQLSEIDAASSQYQPQKVIMGGGTDLMVQQHDEIAETKLNLFSNRGELKLIKEEDDSIVIGSACTANDIMSSVEIQQLFPKIKEYFKLISSEPIRNMGTIAGNIINASPIGDLSIFFLALNAEICIESPLKTVKKKYLKDFFLDYKKLDMEESEFVRSIEFKKPQKEFYFNFEKVSKRTHLDIASVNSAIKIAMDGDIISNCHVSTGGVKAIPLFLKETSEYLKGKKIDAETVKEANEILQKEISPISDVRGSAEYKRLLARQLFYAHFIKLFPSKVELKKLIS